MLDLVFDIYTQLEPTNGHIEGGLGVGLTLAKNLVELHGGRIEARSAGPGHGSEFIVRLPMLARDGPRSQAHLGNEGASHEVTQGRLDAHRILVVDDNRDAAKSLGVLLRLLGAEVNVVHNGPSALKAMTAFRPTVVLLDIGMPGMDGYQVARNIRQQDEFQDVALIALTGWGQEKDRRRSQAAGFNYHLTKPAELSALEALLASLETDPSHEK